MSRPAHPVDLDPAAVGVDPVIGWRPATPEEALALRATARGGVGLPTPPDLDDVLRVLPGTEWAVAVKLGITDGAARWALSALLRDGRIEVAGRERGVAIWRAVTL